MSAGTGAPKAARQVHWHVCSQKSPTALQPSTVDGQGCVYINGTGTPGASVSSPSRHFNFLVLFRCEGVTSSSDFNSQWQLCFACRRMCCFFSHFTGGYYCRGDSVAYVYNTYLNTNTYVHMFFVCVYFKSTFFLGVHYSLSHLGSVIK